MISSPMVTSVETVATAVQPSARLVALLDCNSDDEDSQMEASLTSFEKVRTQRPRGLCSPHKSCHSGHESDGNISFTAGKSTSFCKDGAEAVQMAQENASRCVFESIRDLFSREKTGSTMVNNIQKNFGSCHDQVDAVLIKVFDQPIDELEMPASIDASASASFNEDLTIDSARQSGRFEEGPQRQRLLDEQQSIDKSQQRSFDESISATLELSRVPTTDSEAASLLGFKEALYKSLDTKLDEILADDEDKQLPSPPSLDMNTVAAIPTHTLPFLAGEDSGKAEEHNTSNHTRPSSEATEDSGNENANIFKTLELQEKTKLSQEIFQVKESRMEENAVDNTRTDLSSPSMDELDRLLRTDIEKLDRVGERLHQFKKIGTSSEQPKVNQSLRSVTNAKATVFEQSVVTSTPDAPKTVEIAHAPSSNGSAPLTAPMLPRRKKRYTAPALFSDNDIPVRGTTRRVEKEPEYIDLVHYKPPSACDDSTHSFKQRNEDPRRQGFCFEYAEEEIIDLTMYDGDVKDQKEVE